MPRVEVFDVPGLDPWFNSADHRPPHFHAELLGVWEVRVFFLRDPSEMIERKWGAMAKGAKLKELLTLATRRRAELLAEWERKVSVRDPGPER